MGLGCFGDRYITINNVARLVFDIRLIALIAVPVFGYISIESQRKRNADFLYHASVKSLVCRQKPLQNTSLLHPNPWKNVNENSCAHLDDVELERRQEQISNQP